MNTLTKTSIAAAILALFTAPFATVPEAGPVAMAERTVFITILGAQGPVAGGVQPADLSVTEDGTAREITSVEVASAPVATAILVDTTRAASNAMIHLRQSVIDYATAITGMDPAAQIAVAQFGGQAMITQPFTSSVDDITQAVGRLVAQTDGSALLNEGLIEVSKALSELETQRRFIITINMEPTKEFSQVNFTEVAAAVRDSSATVYSLQILSGSTDRDPGREQLLNALTSSSGGMLRATQTPQDNLSSLMGSIAQLAGTQFAVTFTRPDGEAKAEQTNVSVVGREGFQVLMNRWSGN